MSSILIVEDDQFIREMYAFILRKDGHDVVEAQDGAIGLTEAQKGGFDVILLDLMMPNVDGLTFLKKLNDEPPKKKNGPIVVLSNLAYGDAKQKALDLGAVDFFVKADLEPSEIRATVKKLLEKK